MTTTLIRSARLEDLDAINAIYNHYVAHSTATFAETPLTAEERLAWWKEHEGGYPVLAACLEGEVIGWASLGPFHRRSAYRFTVEDSVYLRPEACGKGLGRRLLVELLERGRGAGFHSVVAVIAADQEPSLHLHEALGFREVGRFREVGWKFERWLDVAYLQRAF